MRPDPRFAPPLLAVAAAALLAGGCGAEPSSGGPARTVASGTTLEVIGDEYSFDPGELVVEGTEPLTIELVNAGALAHNLRVIDGEGEDLGGTPTFQGGQTRSGTVELEAGDYTMVCTVGDHAALGMEGRFTVVEESARRES